MALDSGLKSTPLPEFWLLAMTKAQLCLVILECIIWNVEVKTKNNEFLNWHTSYWESLDTWLAIKNWVFNFYFLYFGFWNHCSKAIDKISSIHENTTSKSDHLQESNFTKYILSTSFGMDFVWHMGIQARSYFWGSRVWDIYLCRTFYQSSRSGTLPFHQSISIYMHCEGREYERKSNLTKSK